MLRVSQNWALLLNWPHLDAVLVIELLSLSCKPTFYTLLCDVDARNLQTSFFLCCQCPLVALLTQGAGGSLESWISRGLASFCFLPVFPCITHSCFFTQCCVCCCSSWSAFPKPAISDALRDTRSSLEHFLPRRFVPFSKLQAPATPGSSHHAQCGRWQLLLQLLSLCDLGAFQSSYTFSANSL